MQPYPRWAGIANQTPTLHLNPQNMISCLTGTSAVVEDGSAAAASDAVTWAPGPAADSTELVQLQQHQHHAAHKQHQKRLYFIDWLRTVLTVFVVLNHVWNSCRPKGGDFYW